MWRPPLLLSFILASPPYGTALKTSSLCRVGRLASTAPLRAAPQHQQQQDLPPVPQPGRRVSLIEPHPSLPTTLPQPSQQAKDGTAAPVLSDSDKIWAALAHLQEGLHSAWSEAQRSLGLPMEHHLESVSLPWPSWIYMATQQPDARVIGSDASESATDGSTGSSGGGDGILGAAAAAAMIPGRFSWRPGSGRLRSAVKSLLARPGRKILRIAAPLATAAAGTAATTAGAEAPIRPLDVMTGSKADAKFRLRPAAAAAPSPLWGAAAANTTAAAGAAAAGGHELLGSSIGVEAAAAVADADADSTISGSRSSSTSMWGSVPGVPWGLPPPVVVSPSKTLSPEDMPAAAVDAATRTPPLPAPVAPPVPVEGGASAEEEDSSADEEILVYSIPAPKHMEITVNQRPMPPAPAAKSGAVTTVKAAPAGPGADWSAQGERVLRMLRLEQHRRRAVARTRDLHGAAVEPRLLEAACGTAAAVPSRQAAQQFSEQIGLPQLLRALAASDSGGAGAAPPLAAVRGLARLVDVSPATATAFAEAEEADAVLSRLTAALVAPLGPPPRRAARALRSKVSGTAAQIAARAFGVAPPPPRKLVKFPAEVPAVGAVYPAEVPRADFRSMGVDAAAAAAGPAERGQVESIKLLYNLALASDAAVERLQRDDRLVAALRAVAGGGLTGKMARYRQGKLSPVQRLVHKLLAALGVDEWVPKSAGQRGLRILCFDGGGTRGVMSIQLLQRLVAATGKEPTDTFDLILGTSTGGIVAGLVGILGYSAETCEEMYDALIPMIFMRHPTAGVKLALKQAFYDEHNWMGILQRIVGDLRLIDSADDPLRPKVACPSTVISVNPSKLWIWRNYNYPPGSRGRYAGSFRHMVRECVRATTAAPTFFSPLMLDGALYSDGALLANNPTCVALHEAAHIFPGVPVEAVVSLGTGCFNETARDFSDPAVGWDGIVNQLISSATETENTHDILTDLLPRAKYFRFNPVIPDDMSAIDEIRPERLRQLKNTVAEYFEHGDNAARLEELAKILRR